MRTLFPSITALMSICILTIPVDVYGLASLHTMREMRNALAELFLITAVLFLLAIIITLYKLLSRSKRIKTAVVFLVYLAAVLVLITTLVCTYIYRCTSGIPILGDYRSLYL